MELSIVMKRFGNKQNRILKIQNHWGSVEHFYHFIFGFLIPLEKYIFENLQGDLNCIVRSCGPVMDSILIDIIGNKTTILEQREHAELLESVTSEHVVQLSGFDHPKLYSEKIVTEFSSRVIENIGDNSSSNKLNDVSNNKQEPRIIIIDRGAPHEFYLSEKSEKPDASKMRRSIPNMQEIFQAVKTKFPNAHYAQMEHSPIKEQISLFESADVIIAQHGAALSNLIWCQPECLVIEILPLSKYLSPPFFKSIATIKNLPHKTIIQLMNHSKIKPSRILSALSQWNYS